MVKLKVQKFQTEEKKIKMKTEGMGRVVCARSNHAQKVYVNQG